jgi:signal transduction histidine kinase
VTRRLLLGYVAIVLVLAGSLAVPFGLVFAERQREQFAVALERDAVVLATVYEDDLQKGVAVDPQAAIAYSERTGARVVVVNQEGVSVVDTGDDESRSFTSRPEIVTALSGGRFSGARFSQTLGADLFIGAVPVASGPHVYGAVRLTVFNGEIDAQVRRMWLSLGAVVLVAVGATAVVAFATARSITRPIADLRHAASRIAEGDFSTGATTGDAPPEIAELAAAFDDMAIRLERLLESQRAFVADASHQLRTPLTAVRLRLENLEATATGAETRDIADIVIEVERLSTMVDQLLELSRAGGLEAIPVDVGAVVEQRVRLWEGVADDQGITLTTVTPADTPCMAAVVPGGMEQILDNLIDNAIRYSPDGGRVSVAVSAASNGLCVVEVTDTGPGVPDADLPRIFDRFWRGGSGQPGTGLGLAIVSHLVMRSGGTVSAAPAPGGGLAVRVSLLTAAADETNAIDLED